MSHAAEFGLDEDDGAVVSRAQYKCSRGEIDQEFLILFKKLHERHMNPVLCDHLGRRVNPGDPTPPGFVLKVGTCSCTNTA